MHRIQIHSNINNVFFPPLEESETKVSLNLSTHNSVLCPQVSFSVQSRPSHPRFIFTRTLFITVNFARDRIPLLQRWFFLLPIIATAWKFAKVVMYIKGGKHAASRQRAMFVGDIDAWPAHVPTNGHKQLLGVLI